jgi:anaerobic magnesium-protoporphyrin IX monomethyl ester cyclase
MKICLINPIAQKNLWETEIASHEPPLGLLYIAAIAERSGHEVMLLERRRIIGRKQRTENNLRELDEETARRIRRFEPSFVGITAATPLITDAYRASAIVKESNPRIRTMIGGHHPTAEPKRTLDDCTDIDAVCIGEGEFTFLEFAGGVPLENIKGIAYRRDGKTSFTEKRPFYQDIDKLPFPSRHLLDRGYYFSRQETTIRGGHRLVATSIIASRGCPYRCAFCQNSINAESSTGQYLRFHSPAYVAAQIEHLIKDYAVEGILFAEDIFSVNKKNVRDICELMIKKGIDRKIKWAANLRVDSIDKELLTLMKRAGCVQLIYGCESGSQATLDRLRKMTTVEGNFRAVELTKKAGIFCEVNVMMGLPGETEEDFLKTTAFLKKAKPDRVVKGKFYPLPGTPLYEELRKEGAAKEPSNWDDLWDHYVHADFTFAAMNKKRFKDLCLKMDREAVYRINYAYEIRNLLPGHLLMAAARCAVMFAHLLVLYMPRRIQRIFQRAADILKSHTAILP